MTALLITGLLTGVLILALAARGYFRATSPSRRLASIQLERLRTEQHLQVLTQLTLAAIRAEVRRHRRTHG